MHPTPEDRDAAAAWAAYQSRHDEPAERVVRWLVAGIIGVLLGLALLHFATPCAPGHLCMAPLLAPRAGPAWLRTACRRLHIWALRARARQLLGLAQSLALDASPGSDIRLTAVLSRFADLARRIQALESARAT